MYISTTGIKPSGRRFAAHTMATGFVRVLLVTVSVSLGVYVHESTHFIVGRLVGIPATFTGLTSVGIPQVAVHLYAGWRLALMNGIAPLLSVVLGFVALAVVRRFRNLPYPLRFAVSWWAIFGIPYAGLQLMALVFPVDFSGNGADSAAVAGYFKIGPLALAILCFVGFAYYLWSSRPVRDAIQAVEHTFPRTANKAPIAPWRHAVAWFLVIIAVAAAVRFALSTYGLAASAVSLELLAICAGWSGACACWTRWRDPDACVFWSRWLIPGAISLIAMIPLGSIGGGNDFSQIWLIQLPPVFAATMLASRVRTATVGVGQDAKKTIKS